MQPCPSSFNLAAHVLAPAARLPDKVALAILAPARAQRWSFARLERAVLGFGGALQASGLPPGARILMRLGNSVAFPVAFLGACAAGYVPVPTAAGLTEEEITRLAAMIEPGLILAQGDVSLPRGGWPCRHDLDAMMAHAPTRYAMGDPDRLAYMVFTSGSSGQPKAVAHAHRAIWARQIMHEGWYGLRESDRLCHAGALNWTFTLGTGLLDPWSVGATAMIPADGVSIDALPLLLKRHDATLLAGAPGVFRRLLSYPTTLDLPKMRHGLCAGEKLPEEVRQSWLSHTATALHEALGMSECSTFLSGAPPRPAPQGTLGFAQPGRRVAVLDPQGGVLPQGDVGTLAIHRSDPGLMLGYWRSDGPPDLPLNGDWFETGDLVAQTPDDAFVYHGRRDDLITAGGFRISPLEIETALGDCPDLVECAALALRPKPDTTIVALVYCGAVTAEALRDLAERRLARYKQPRAYLRLPALPRNRNGKLDRRALAPLAQEALE